MSDEGQGRATRVLFVHGLESGPHGRKARLLAEAGFEVVSERMPCRPADVARDPIVIVGALAALITAIEATLAAGLLGLALALVIGAALAPQARALIAARVLARSVEVQRALLARGPVDVVVGSSFGGAVSLELLRGGAWTGPTVLLCPAHVLIAHRARRPAPSLRALSPAQAQQVVVVHGRADQVVPLAHSEALVAGTAARLIIVDDDHRLTATATATSLAAWIAGTGVEAS